MDTEIAKKNEFAACIDLDPIESGDKPKRSADPGELIQSSSQQVESIDSNGGEENFKMVENTSEEYLFATAEDDDSQRAVDVPVVGEGVALDKEVAKELILNATESSVSPEESVGQNEHEISSSDFNKSEDAAEDEDESEMVENASDDELVVTTDNEIFEIAFERADEADVLGTEIAEYNKFAAHTGFEPTDSGDNPKGSARRIGNGRERF